MLLANGVVELRKGSAKDPTYINDSLGLRKAAELGTWFRKILREGLGACQSHSLAQCSLHGPQTKTQGMFSLAQNAFVLSRKDQDKNMGSPCYVNV